MKKIITIFFLICLTTSFGCTRNLSQEEQNLSGQTIHTGTLTVSSLASCDTVDTNASGVFACGSDDGAGTTGNPFNQWLDTTSTPTFGELDITTDLLVGGNSTTTATSTAQGYKGLNLVSCDTIDTNAEGHFVCGSDATGASVGAAWQWIVNEGDNYIQSTSTYPIYSVATSVFAGLHATTTQVDTLHIYSDFTTDDTGLVSNLNAEQLNSQVGAYYLNWDNFTAKPATSTILNLLDTEYRISMLNASTSNISTLNATTTVIDTLNVNTAITIPDPADCAANQFANAIGTDAALSCAAIADGDIPDDITITEADPVWLADVIYTDHRFATLNASTTEMTTASSTALTIGDGNLDMNSNAEISNYFSAACNAGEYIGDISDAGVFSCTDATTEINTVVNALGGTNLTCASQSCDVDDVFILQTDYYATTTWAGNNNDLLVTGNATTTATSTAQGFKGLNLISCDTIDTTAEGHFVCGSDETGAGGGELNWLGASDTWLYPSTTVGMIVSASSTITSLSVPDTLFASTTYTDILTVSESATTTNSLFVGGSLSVVTTTPSTNFEFAVTGDGIFSINLEVGGTINAVGNITGGNLSGTNTGDISISGQDYLTLSSQAITIGEIEPDDLAGSDFGDFSCDGDTCTLDTDTVAANEILLSAALDWTGSHTWDTEAIFTGGLRSNVVNATTTNADIMTVYTSLDIPGTYASTTGYFSVGTNSGGNTFAAGESIFGGNSTTTGNLVVGDDAGTATTTIIVGNSDTTKGTCWVSEDMDGGTSFAYTLDGDIFWSTSDCR